MSRENKSAGFDAYDLGSQRQKQRYGLAPLDLDDDEDVGGPGSSSAGQIEVVIPFSEQKSDQYKPLVDEWGQALSQLVDDKAEDLTRLLMEGEGKFGAVSTQRKKQKQSREKQAANEKEAGLANSHGAGGDLPQHPLLNGQRYDGMADHDSPLAAHSAQDELFENIAEQIENNPELKLSPELSNNLKLRIDLYNQKKLENALISRPTLTRDHRPGM
ncbi:MAG TPA: hypothetical protein VHE99_02570 [Gammaproteobacteria bacterium]|nr:hypothetical protein [Gammaproteobacteria bacterium]